MRLFRFYCPLLLLTASTLHAQDYDKLPEQKNIAFYRLKGAVKTVTEQKWIPSKDSAIYDSRTAIETDATFAKERTETTDFDKGGILMRQASAESEGRKKNKMKELERVFYYRKDKLVGIAITEDHKKVDSVEFHYRKKGQMDYYRVFNSKGEAINKVDYTYKNGRVFSVRKKDENQLPVSTMKYLYKNDSLVETQHFDAQSRRIETRKYSYKFTDDHSINDSHSILDDKGALKGGLLLVKDTLGRVLERNVIGDEREVTEYNAFKYNEKGDIATEKLFNQSVELTITNRYTYDDTGNWIKKETFHNGILNAIVLREVIYY